MLAHFSPIPVATHRTTTMRRQGMLAAVGCVIFVNGAIAADGKKPTPVAPEVQAVALRNELQSTELAVRLAAVRSLAHHKAAPFLVPELTVALKDGDGEVREWAATVLGSQGAASVGAVPQLIAQLQTDSANKAREAAARALGRIGKAAPAERRAVPALERAATDDADSVTRVVSLGALALIEPDAPGRIAAIVPYLQHDDALTRMKGAHALGYLLDKAQSTGPAIADVLRRATDPYQRGYVARSLGQIGAKDQLPVLLEEYARETDQRAQGEMRGAIKRLGGTVPKATK